MMMLAIAIVYTLFLKPPHDAMIPPPAIIPTENAISIAVKRHTSSPKRGNRGVKEVP